MWLEVVLDNTLWPGLLLEVDVVKGGLKGHDQFKVRLFFYSWFYSRMGLSLVITHLCYISHYKYIFFIKFYKVPITFVGHMRVRFVTH